MGKKWILLEGILDKSILDFFEEEKNRFLLGTIMVEKNWISIETT